MPNGRTFTKSALRILFLSAFSVSNINYYLACSLPIYKNAFCVVHLARSVIGPLSLYFATPLAFNAHDGQVSLGRSP